VGAQDKKEEIVMLDALLHFSEARRMWLIKM